MQTTMKAIEKFNISPDIIPAEYTVEKLIEESINKYKDSTKVLIVTSNLSPVNTSLLKENYNICFDKIDLFTFCSSSTVRSFFKNIKKIGNKMKIASIGPVTSETIKSCGYNVNIEAKKYCMDGLVEAIVDYYS